MQNPMSALRSPSVVVQSIARGCTSSRGDERHSSWPAYWGLEIPPCTNARQSDACHAGVRLPGPSGSDKVAITVLVISSTIAHRAHNISVGASEAGTDLSPEKCGRVRTRVRRPRRPCLGCRCAAVHPRPAVLHQGKHIRHEFERRPGDRFISCCITTRLLRDISGCTACS